MKKNDFDRLVQMKHITLVVHHAHDFTLISTVVKYPATNGGDYAVFAIPNDSGVYIQITKWYKYQGAALRKLAKLANTIK